MSEQAGGGAWLWVRIALVAFVLAWILGPDELRGAVPILPVFLVALGLEVHFLVGALRGGHHRRAPDRLPQEVDRDRYGFQRVDDEDDEEGDDEDTPFELARELEPEREDEEEGDEQQALYEPEPPSRLGPVWRFAVGLGLIAVLGATIWYVDSRSGWGSLSGETKGAAVKRFSEEAALIAEKPVSIRCDESRDYVGAVQHADGVAQVGGELAILTPEICDDLYRLAFEGETTGSRTGRAIAVLAHEAWHLRGVSDEGTTECYALQSGVDLGVRLGLSEGRARQLMRQQLTENALRGVGTLEYRVTSECRDGGPLDLDPADGRFP